MAVVEDITNNLLGLQALARGRRDMEQQDQQIANNKLAQDSLRRYQLSSQEGNPDYEALNEAIINSPELAQNVLAGLGIREKRQGVEAADFAVKVAGVFDNKPQLMQLVKSRVEYLQSQGRDAKDTIEFAEAYLQGDLQGAKNGLKSSAAALANQGYLDKDIYASTFGTNVGKFRKESINTTQGIKVYDPSTGTYTTATDESGNPLVAPQYDPTLQSEVSRARTSGAINARVAGGGEAQRIESEGTQEGKTAVARRDLWKTQALGAAENIPTLRRAIDLQEAINTGGGINAIRKVANYLGVASENEGELNALFGQNILGQLKSTFGGSPTEGEREALAQAQASFNQTGKINSRLLKNALKLAEQRVQRGKRAASADKDDATIQEIDAAMAITLGDDEGGRAPSEDYLARRKRLLGN